MLRSSVFKTERSVEEKQRYNRGRGYHVINSD